MNNLITGQFVFGIISVLLLAKILHYQFLIFKRLKFMAQELDDLKAAVAKEAEVGQSAITLLNGLKAALDAAGTDPAALKALSDQLGSESQALADAVIANTPAAPAQ